MNGQVQTLPWWQSIQQQLESWVQQFNISLQDIARIVSFFGIGFFTGFLLKKYLRYFFIITLTLIFFFIVFDRFGIILVDWVHIQQLTGIDPQSTIQQTGEQILAMAQAHIILVISGFIGFLIGYRVG